MQPANFPEAQHFLGRPSDMSDDECGALPVARGIYQGKYPCVISAFRPTPAELEALNNGGLVYLHVIGHTMQPVMLSTKIETETLAGRN